jgi:hypothetical protein
MKVYINKWAAITGLHESGFTEDFVLSGNKILWVQQKILLLQEDIQFLEYHCFDSASGNKMIIFGLITKCSYSKGILIVHQKNHKSKMIPVIDKELVSISRMQMADSYTGVL